MITYKEKDTVLKWFCLQDKAEIHCAYNAKNLLKDTGLTVDEIMAILTYFKRNNLISNNSFTRHTSIFYTALHIEAFDLYLKGGFTVIEETLHKNLEKLQLELQDLKSDFPEKTQTFSSIISAITSVTALLIGGA